MPEPSVDPATEEVIVDPEILAQIDEVRESGETNMHDHRGVMRAASDREMFALVVFIDEYPKTYHAGISKGFKAREETDDGTSN